MKSLRCEKTLWIVPPKRLDATTADIFQEMMLVELGREEQYVVFDFTACDYMSSVGLRTLLVAAQKLHKSPTQIVFAGAQPTLLGVFKSAGFMMLFPFHETVQQASQTYGLPLPESLNDSEKQVD